MKEKGNGTNIIESMPRGNGNEYHFMSHKPLKPGSNGKEMGWVVGGSKPSPNLDKKEKKNLPIKKMILCPLSNSWHGMFLISR